MLFRTRRAIRVSSGSVPGSKQLMDQTLLHYVDERNLHLGDNHITVVDGVSPNLRIRCGYQANIGDMLCLMALIDKPMCESWWQLSIDKKAHQATCMTV